MKKFSAVKDCVISFLMKKRNKKNLIFVLVICVVALCVILLTNFQSTDSHYNSNNTKNAVGTVTLTIRCDTIAHSESEFVPENGIILDTTEYEIEEGDTVYDILTEATAENQIHIETEGSTDSVFVQGINHIYGLDYGELSGWMYQVNGTSQSVSCGKYKLSDGDAIEWLYTCNMGEDLK